MKAYCSSFTEADYSNIKVPFLKTLRDLVDSSKTSLVEELLGLVHDRPTFELYKYYSVLNFFDEFEYAPVGLVVLVKRQNELLVVAEREGKKGLVEVNNEHSFIPEDEFSLPQRLSRADGICFILPLSNGEVKRVKRVTEERLESGYYSNNFTPQQGLAEFLNAPKLSEWEYDNFMKTGKHNETDYNGVLMHYMSNELNSIRANLEYYRRLEKVSQKFLMDFSVFNNNNPQFRVNSVYTGEELKELIRVIPSGMRGQMVNGLWDFVIIKNNKNGDGLLYILDSRDEDYFMDDLNPDNLKSLNNLASGDMMEFYHPLLSEAKSTMENRHRFLMPF